MAGPHSDSQPLSQGLSKRLPPGGLITIVWCSVALAGAFIILRTLIRITRIERLGYEDHCVYFAYIILIINAVLQTLQIPHLYYLTRANVGLEPDEAALLWHGNEYVKYELCIIGLFWTVLWSVKASWLALYWRLFTRLQVYQRWWKGVAVTACATYAGCWILNLITCHPASPHFNFDQCEKASNLEGSTILIAFSTLADVLTDLLIMCMPLHMLYKSRLTFRRKIGLAVVFSLVIAIICVAIARAIEISKGTHQDAVLLALWGIIESTTSIIVGCLPPFKSLFEDIRASTRRDTPARTRSTAGSGETNPSNGSNGRTNAWWEPLSDA